MYSIKKYSHTHWLLCEYSLSDETYSELQCLTGLYQVSDKIAALGAPSLHKKGALAHNISFHRYQMARVLRRSTI